MIQNFAVGNEHIILQRRSSSTICLSVDQQNLNKVMKIHHTSTECSKANLNALWIVLTEQLQHSASGLCLSADGAIQGALKVKLCSETKIADHQKVFLPVVLYHISLFDITLFRPGMRNLLVSQAA